MKVSLLVAFGQPQQKEIPIRLNQFLIGRDPECHLRPSSPLVSKRHCALLVRENKVFLRDFDSTNGTSVNDQPLKGETELRHGDHFKVGPLACQLKLETTSVALPVPGKTAPKSPLPDPVPKTGIDDDDVAELLLNLTGEPRPASADDGIPTGSTVMEMMPPPTGDDKKSEEADPKKPGSKLKIDPVATSNAAKAILDKYMRRPRG